jgi:peptide-methionine (S)-S-oxide reductase
MVSRLISKASGLAFVAAIIGAIALAAPSSAEDYAPLPEVAEGQKSAIFAGGCFWCIESDFDKVPGVISTTSGYSGGTSVRPSYKQVTYVDEGHYEVLKVVYDPTLVSYDALLDAFWHSVDPTDDGGQFCDRGPSYETAIFVTEEQRAIAEASKKRIAEGEYPKKPIVTPILDAKPFYPAETYHQDYYQKNPIRYRYYRSRCGRDATVKRVWGPNAYKGIPKS